MMMTKAVYLSGSAAIVALSVALASPARAQSAAGDPAPAAAVSGDPSSPWVDASAIQDTTDIIVTGQKRAERLQDVPKQVSVVSQAQLAVAGVSRLTDLAAALPEISAQPQNQTPKAPGIRGISPVAFSIGVQSQTGLIVDDIPQSTFSTLAYNLQDLERLEVFAGPQSTLSGRNATGGIINFVTRTPSSTPEYDFSLEQTTDRQTKVTAFLTGPLTDNLTYSLSGIFDKWDGNLRNALKNDQYLEGYNTKGIRAKLRWEPTDRLTATLTGYYLYTHRVSL